MFRPHPLRPLHPTQWPKISSQADYGFAGIATNDGGNGAFLLLQSPFESRQCDLHVPPDGVFLSEERQSAEELRPARRHAPGEWYPSARKVSACPSERPTLSEAAE